MIAASVSFSSEYFFPKIIVACFEKDAIGNREGNLDFTIENGIVNTKLPEFNKLAQKYRIVNLERFIKHVKDLDWNDKGAYIQNIYRIYLESNDNIEAALTALRQEKNIIYAEYETKNRLYHTPNDPLYPMQWHLPQIYCPEAWDFTTGGEDVIVGIVDAGIKWNHPDLQDNIWINQAELDAGMTINWANGTVSGGNGIDDDGNGEVDDVIGYNFFGTDNNDSYQDYAANDHGTHVAGCAGAVGDNNLGVCGSALHIKLISSRHAPTTYEYPYVQDGYSGIIYCTDSGADAINCSWGGPGGGSTANNVINYANDHGALVVTAAGNDDTEHNSSYQDYPSDCDNALCVAATDQNDLKTYFSDYGDPIDVCAPGININSTIIENDGYTSYQGTSMASPIVAGIAALAKSVHPNITPTALRQRIMDTCDYIDDLNPGYEGLLGAGRVNAFTAALYDIYPYLTIENVVASESEGDGDGVANPGEIINVAIMVQNGFFSGGFWLTATDVTATLSCEVEGINIIQGTSSFTDIAGGVSVWNNDQPFQIQAVETSNIFDIPFTVTLSANMNSEHPYQVQRNIEIHLSLNQAGWPYEVGGASSSSPLIIDINNDGNKEIVFGDYAGIVHAVNSDGLSELSGFPTADLGGNISSAVAVADISGDSNKEIVFGNESNDIMAINSDGQTLFSYDAGGQIKGNPMIADLNGNGNKEIIACTFTFAKIVVLEADGSDFGIFPITLDSGVLSSPAVADLNGDGNLEIIFASLNGNLHAVSITDGNDIAGFPYDLGMGSWNGPIVADIDSDAEPEILVGTLGGNIVAVNNDGTLVFERSVGGQVKTSIVVSDLDGDENPEIIFGNSLGNLYVVDNQGNDLDNFPLDIGSTIESTPILADMDNDGSVDMIFGDNAGYLHSVGIDGIETDNFPIYLNSALKTSAVIGDADGDGDPDIAIPNQSSYVLIDYKRTIGNILWPCFKGNPERTGNASDISAAGNNDIPKFDNFLKGNYPNPFFISGNNAKTNIGFSLKNSENISLSVYNIRGQLVRTLVSEPVKAGNHFISWDGTDNRNRTVASGIYFYKLSANNFVATKKMIVIR